MPRKKKKQPVKEPEKVEIKPDFGHWSWAKVAIPNLPYAQAIPKDVGRMTEMRKKRIIRVLHWHNRGLNPREVAKKMGIDTRIVKSDLTAAIALTNEKMHMVPDVERKIMHALKNYTGEAAELMTKLKSIVEELEEEKTYLDPKRAAAFAMIIGELRQTLELGAKLTGELQTGTRVNVVVFSSLVKKMIDVIQQEVDVKTFLRIRDRIRLELQGQQPLGSRGGDVELEQIEAEVVDE